MTSSIGGVQRSLSVLQPSKFSANERLGEKVHLDPDFKEFVESFVANDVRFLIVGGYAVAVHGLPRYTGDLDAWIWVSPQNAERVLRSLEAFGFSELGLTKDDFLKPDSVIQLGYPPYRIDILTAIEGVEFDDAWSRRLIVAVDDLEVPFIGRDDLLANKRAAGRPQDIADVARLTEQELD
jgi:glycine cleavage system aminomethyltransferase T